MRKRGLLLAAALVVAVSAGVSARQANQQSGWSAKTPQGLISSWDRNADDKVTMQEFPGPDYIFERLDIDEDGMLTAEDLQTIQREEGRRRTMRQGMGPQGAQPSQRQIPGAQQLLTTWDRNGDSEVSRSEFPGEASLFNELDTNGNDRLSLQELQSMSRSRRGELATAGRPSAQGYIRHWDRNGDNRLSPNEFPGNQSAFNRLDRNSDGYVSLQEFQQARPPDRGPTTAPQPGASPDQFINRWDHNGDGRLSSSEFPGSTAAFNRLDRDNDGYIASQELRQSGQDWRDRSGAGNGSPARPSGSAYDDWWSGGSSGAGYPYYDNWQQDGYYGTPYSGYGGWSLRDW